ncbi:GAF domain-containing protein [Patulibacter sp. NPDC049589]|uniref:GAF domain-containing protein n=1 Tax=Patulibacter sp. NPDC049589 TaxID=3154731 RepID=UPI003443E978
MQEVVAVNVVAHRKDRLDRPDALVAYRRVADAALADVDLGATLTAVARNACELLGVDRCSVFMRDGRSPTRFRGYAAHAAEGVDIVPRMVCGVQADRMTAEIVAGRRPIFVRDAPHDGRPVRSAMRRLDVRAILGVPMIAGDEVIGLLFLDQAGANHTFTDEDQSDVAGYANLCAHTVAQVQRLAGLETTVGTLTRNVATLKRVTAIDARFATLVETAPNVEEITTLLAELTGLPSAMHTAESEPVWSVIAEGLRMSGGFPLDPEVAGDPMVGAELSAIAAGGSAIVGPYRHCGLVHRTLVAPVTVAGVRWGYASVVECQRRFTTADKAAVERAAHTMAVAFSYRPSVAAGPPHALAADDGVDAPGLEGLGLSLAGVAGELPRLVCLIHRRDGRPWTCEDPSELEEAFDRAYGSVRSIVMPDGDRGVALVAEQDRRVAPDLFVERTRVAIAAVLQDYREPGLVAAISPVVQDVDDVSRAYTECRQLMRCRIELCPPDAPPLAASDLGVGRLLLGSSDARAMDRYVEAVLAPLLKDDSRHRMLLTTLHVFLESARSPRQAGRMLNVHENTIRYRLARITDLLRLNIATDLGDQLTAQVALLIMRLQGRLPGVNVLGNLESDVPLSQRNVLLGARHNPTSEGV